jgi:hypothetical protein
LDAGEQPSQPSRSSIIESKPASKGPAMDVPTGKVMPLYGSVPAIVVTATDPSIAAAYLEELDGADTPPITCCSARPARRSGCGYSGSEYNTRASRERSSARRSSKLAPAGTSRGKFFAAATAQASAASSVRAIFWTAGRASKVATENRKIDK